MSAMMRFHILLIVPQPRKACHGGHADGEASGDGRLMLGGL